MAGGVSCCSAAQARQVWLLKAWLCGLRLSPKGWNGTFHVYLLEEIGFVQSPADPCLYILNEGEVLLLVYVDDILFSGHDEKKVTTIIEQLKEWFDTVDLGDVRFLLGMAIQRNIDAGTISLSQTTYAKAVLDRSAWLTRARRRHRLNRGQSISWRLSLIHISEPTRPY